MDDAGARLYGRDDDDQGALVAGHVYAALLGAPLDGELLLDVTGWVAAELVEGALLITDRGLYGPGGRAFYAPAEGDPAGPFLWHGDTP
ncbi:hypothetical protein [Streptomyces sp. H27-H5]|uniref:hypothetical protein n=1 Tax=Streptomyces sp. H27-H5 TaxID=2996460 RepID=UPI0022707794|nr:hypothetical protein [Streptomyces sp. H27-H5]MCY0962719.1 hypothetical protein [Streptomyces sp. H27-H5]